MLRSLPDLIQEARTNLRCITAVQAIEEQQLNGGVVIDVREPGELQQKAAPKSIPIPRGVLEMKIGEVAPAIDDPIYLHCATGGRATLAAEQLTRLGYNSVAVITCNLEAVCVAQNA